MLKRFFYLFAVIALVMPMAAARAQDDDRWEHHREHCEQLEHEEHEIRDRLEHTQDHVERDRIEHRLHEIAEDRDHHCRR
jgi:hypothetical protein